MPHFSEDLSAEDPNMLRRLRTMLHGSRPAPRCRPRLEERFGVAAGEDRDTTLAGSDPPSYKPRRRLRRPATT